MGKLIVFLKKIFKYISPLYEVIIVLAYGKKQYFLCNSGIGDTIVFLSKLCEYRSENPIRKVNIIIQDSHAVLLEGYMQYIDTVKIIKDKSLCRLNVAARRNWLPRNIKYILPQGAISILNNYQNSIVDLVNMSMGLDNYNYIAPIFTWSEKRKHEILEQCKAIKGKTVILAPRAVSVPEIKQDHWERLVQKYQEKGFYVITNLKNEKEIPLKGTIGICLPLNEIYLLAEYCGYFVGLRSGLCDLLAFSSCEMLVLYPTENGQDYKKLYTLANMHFTKKIYELDDKELYHYLNGESEFI